MTGPKRVVYFDKFLVIISTNGGLDPLLLTRSVNPFPFQPLLAHPYIRNALNLLNIFKSLIELLRHGKWSVETHRPHSRIILNERKR